MTIDQHTYNKVWSKWDENFGRSRVLKVVKLENLQSALNDANQTQGIEHGKYPTYMCTVAPRVPNFHPFRSTISRFQDIAHLPIDFHVKIPKCHNIFNSWQIAKRLTLHSFMTVLLNIKLGPDQIKTAGVAF